MKDQAKANWDQKLAELEVERDAVQAMELILARSHAQSDVIPDGRGMAIKVSEEPIYCAS